MLFFHECSSKLESAQQELEGKHAALQDALEASCGLEIKLDELKGEPLNNPTIFELGTHIFFYAIMYFHVLAL